MAVFVETFTQVKQIELLEELILKLELWFENREVKFNVRSSILGQLKRALEGNKKSGGFDFYDKTEMLLISKKFSAIRFLLEENIDINPDNLKFSLGGSLEPEKDSLGKYNDYLFEMAMASRFSKALACKSTVNLTDVCDVVINNEIAVECKYIHSLKNLRKQIRKGEDQIVERIRNEQVHRGYVAIDLSGVIDKEYYRRFCMLTFRHAVKVPFIQDQYGGYLPEEETYRILNDESFKFQVTKFISDHMQMIIRSALGDDYVLKEGVNAIILHANMAMPFRKGADWYIPVPMSGVTSYIPQSISGDERSSIENELSTLARGLEY